MNEGSQMGMSHTHCVRADSHVRHYNLLLGQLQVIQGNPQLLQCSDMVGVIMCVFWGQI